MADTSWKSVHKAATVVLEGDYPVVVHEAKVGQSQGGKTMLKCSLRVESGPYAGRAITHNFTFSPESPVASSLFFRDLAILGADEKFFNTDPSTQDICDKITGARAIATLEPREWNGMKSEQVKKWTKNTGAAYVATGGSSLPAATSLPAPSSLPAAPANEPPADPF